MSPRPKSLHVVPSLRLSSGGPTESVTRLCEALNAIGAPAEIATVASPGDESEPPANTPVHAFPVAWPRHSRRSPALKSFLEKETARFDLVHVHALWQWPCAYGRKAALGHGKPLVISPRGMLESWALSQSAWLKQFALLSWEGRNLRTCRLLHATSEAEAAQCHSLGYGQEICVIPNGVAVPEGVFPTATGDRKSILFLSRFHPKKGGDLLIEAWAELFEAFPEWRLNLIGPDPEGFRAPLEELARNKGIPPQAIRFGGPVSGGEKWNLLASAGLLALPSHSENFGNVVLEALAMGVPVLTTRGTPWGELETRNCGWWIPCERTALRDTLRAALMQPEADRKAMGERGRAWSRDFSWAAIAHQMAAAYESILKPRGQQ